MLDEVLAVRRSVLFRYRHFEGFCPKEGEFKDLILESYFYGLRTPEFEHNESVKQIIPCTVLLNSKAKKVFAYRRANDERCAEARLRNKWSIGVGGHIETQDDHNPIEAGMWRELREEISMENYPRPELLGYLNWERGVHQYHFALLFLGDTEDDVRIGDGEISCCGFYSVPEFDGLLASNTVAVEEWSRLAWPFIRKRLA
jgi:predicted NUDIX family phosphoesterase